jgi:hypothetical protein
MARTYRIGCLFPSVFFFFLAGAQIQPAASFGDDDTSTLIQIDSERVSKGEFVWRMNGFRSACFNYFMQKYNASYGGPDFWDHPFNNITPGEWIRKRTLQQLVEDKVKIKLMQHYGLLPGFDYTQFGKAYREENEKRKTLIEQGQVIYGIQQFGDNSYYEYILSNALLETEKRMLAIDPPSEKELRDYYGRVKNKEPGYPPFGQVRENIRMQIAAARFQQTLMSKVKEAKIRIFPPFPPLLSPFDQ